MVDYFARPNDTFPQMNDHTSKSRSGGLVDDTLAQEVRQSIQSHVASRRLKVETLIQEGQGCLVVSLSIDGAISLNEARSLLEHSVAEVKKRLFVRDGDCFWIVNIKQENKILQSASGGAQAHANW